MTGAVLTQDPARPPAVLLTGAAGFVGRHVGYALRASGWSVLAIDLRSRGLGPDGRGIELVDSADPRILRDVARGHFDAVVHQAAISDTLETDRRLLTTQNVRKALDLAGACAESRTRFIYASSSSVYGHIVTAEAVAEDAVHDRARCTGPLNEYARSKLTLDEEMASRHPDGLEWAGLRYTNVFGTGEEHKGRMASIISQLITRAADRRPLELFADTLLASRDYIPVEFVAATIVAVLHRGVPAGIYNVGSGTALSFARLLEWCAAFAAPDPLEVRLTPNPYADRYQYWTCADLTRLRTALPHLPTVRLQEVEAAASSLFTARRGRDRESGRALAAGNPQVKAVVADNRGLRLVDLPLPVMPSPEWALVRVACGGICGSDLRRRPSTLDSAGTPVGGGVVVGHEMVGVVECAPRSGSVAVGDRVLVDPRVPCAARGLPSCDACSKGIPNYCRRHWSLEVVDGKAIGFTTGLGGGWAEYVAAHSSMLLRLPDEMAWENAVLAEPLAVAISGLQRVRALAPQRVIIVGGGTLGQLAAAAAEALLPGVEVLLLCRHPFQASAADRVGAASGLSMPDDVGGAFRALAERLGARLVDGPSGPMLLDGPDLVIEAAGTDQALTIALRAAGEEGTVLTLGNTDSCSDLRPLWLKGLRLVGHLELSMGQPKELGEEDRVLDEALMLLRRRPHVHTELVTHAFALPAFRDALAAARERRGSRALKVVLMP